MSELKPCPFCGGEAELHHDYSSESGDWYIIDCLNNGCMRSERSAWDGQQVSTGWRKTESEATEAWNTRAERPPERKPIKPMTDERIKAIESELAETKKQLAEEKANADGHWKNANNWAKQLEESRIENHNLKGVLAEFNLNLKLFLGTYAARFDENGMLKNIDKEPPSLLDLMGILKDGQKEEES